MAVLSCRQQREIELYARIEAIDGVSKPPAEHELPQTDEEGRQMFEQITTILGA